MGAKTAMLVASDGAAAAALQDTAGGDPARAAALIRRLLPGYDIGPDGEEPWELADAVYPTDGTTCVLSVPGLDVVCDRRLALGHPSQMPEHIVAASAGRRLYLHAMHSVVDWLAFAVWEDGRLVRSLSLAPDDGILEDIGDRLPFELPYWAGAYPVAPDPSHEDEEPYPLPFHPLDLGERAMLEFFGFGVEGCMAEDAPEETVDAWAVQLHGFHARER